MNEIELTTATVERRSRHESPEDLTKSLQGLHRWRETSYIGWISNARQRIRQDIARMQQYVSSGSDAPEVEKSGELATRIRETMDLCLARIAERIGRDRGGARKKLDWHRLDLGTGRSCWFLSRSRIPRIAFYPIAANPVTYAHLAIALRTLACHGADHAVLAPAGSDSRKPELGSSESFRHHVTEGLIAAMGLSPLISVSHIARGESFEGEINLFRWLALQDRAVHALYVAGGDHGHYVKNGGLDTLGKLSTALSGAGTEDEKSKAPGISMWPDAPGADHHAESSPGLERHISAIIVDRPGEAQAVPVPIPRGIQALPYERMDALAFTCSSTRVREALRLPRATADLALLPHWSLTPILKMGGLLKGRKR